MILFSGTRHRKRDFAARDVSVRSKHLPSNLVTARLKSLGLRRQGIRRGLLPDCQTGCRLVRIQQFQFRECSIDAHVVVQPDRHIGPLDRPICHRARVLQADFPRAAAPLPSLATQPCAPLKTPLSSLFALRHAYSTRAESTTIAGSSGLPIVTRKPTYAMDFADG